MAQLEAAVLRTRPVAAAAAVVQVAIATSGGNPAALALRAVIRPKSVMPVRHPGAVAAAAAGRRVVPGARDPLAQVVARRWLFWPSTRLLTSLIAN